MSEEETRSRLLTLAAQRLFEHGLGVGLDAIRMERLITDAGVSRASAYRCWPTREQFLADALVHTVEETDLIPESADDITRLRAMIEEHSDCLIQPQARRALTVEVLRQSLDADARRLSQSPRWQFFMALSSTVATIEDAKVRTSVQQALGRMESAFVERRAAIYTNLATMIGYRQREPWQGAAGFRVLAEQAGLTMRGVVSRALVDPTWLDQRTELALFGCQTPAPWSQAEIALVTVLLTHLEPDPTITWDEARIVASLQLFDSIADGLKHAR